MLIFYPQREFGLIGKEKSKGNPTYEIIRTYKLIVTHPARATLPKCVEINTARMFIRQQVCFFRSQLQIGDSNVSDIEMLMT